MRLRNPRLIDEAVAARYRRKCSTKTAASYRPMIQHYDEYVASVHGVTMLEAQTHHVDAFLSHLAAKGGGCKSKADHLRKPCSWCRANGYPDGRSGAGLSPSRCKAHLSAVRFLYFHLVRTQARLDDPCFGVEGPTVKLTRQFVPTVEDVQALLDAPGRPRDRLLAHWLYYCPAPRQAFADARWEDFTDLDSTHQTPRWHYTDKGGKNHVLPVHPVLAGELRLYRDWQAQQAENNPAIADALRYSDTAFVLLTHNGRPLVGQSIAKLVQTRAKRAGVAVQIKGGRTTTRITPHALRRAAASHWLNAPQNAASIDLVQQMLGHADISTTRRHYAFTSEERFSREMMRRSI